MIVHGSHRSTLRCSLIQEFLYFLTIPSTGHCKRPLGPQRSREPFSTLPPSGAVLNTTDGHLVRVKCSPDDTVGDLKKLIAAQTGTDWRKIQLKKWYDMDSAATDRS